MRRISVITPARNASATLPALLDALHALERPADAELEFILVDDASTDGTAGIARDHPADVRVLDGAARGPAAARNAAAAVATGEILAFTDADCIPTPGWLVAGLSALDAGADVVQGAVGPPPGMHVGPFDRTVRVGQMTALYETANLLIRRDLFDRLGGFESWLGTSTAKELGEDVWLGWRAVRSGADVRFEGRAVVHHAVFPGTPWSFATERARRRFFPPLVARIPELRGAFCYRRWFLSRRTAEYDLALVGVLAAAGTRRPWPLLLAVPYGRRVARHALVWGRRAPLVAAADVAADTIGCGALVTGSVTARTPLL